MHVVRRIKMDNNVLTPLSRKPHFGATRDGKLKSHIEYAFLKRYFLLFSNKPWKIKISTQGAEYECYYENFAEDQVNKTEPIEVIASFQKWHDGTMVVVIRPYTPVAPEKKEQAKENNNAQA